ncbi:MAG: hypothetical protein Alpg2KO_00360 [Alphaproteobacteria bacterium]
MPALERRTIVDTDFLYSRTALPPDGLSPSKALEKCTESGVDLSAWFGADAPSDTDDARGKWRPPMFMPRTLCRMMLRVTAVRVEHLGELTDEGAMAEGCIRRLCPPCPEFPSGRCYRKEDGKADTELVWRARPRDAFANYWDKLHGAGDFAACSDKTVLVLAFERV